MSKFSAKCYKTNQKWSANKSLPIKLVHVENRGQPLWLCSFYLTLLSNMTVGTDRAQPILILHGKIPETVQIRTTKSNLKAETLIKKKYGDSTNPIYDHIVPDDICRF